MGRYRTFGGKHWKAYDHQIRDKRTAQRIARQLREKGEPYVRITKESDGYAVWVEG